MYEEGWKEPYLVLIQPGVPKLGMVLALWWGVLVEMGGVVQLGVPVELLPLE